MKRKTKPKPNAKQRELYDAWQQLVAIHAKPLERGTTGRGLKYFGKEVKVKVMELGLDKIPTERNLNQFKSKNPVDHTTANKPKDKIYTGTKMLGVATLHKSNGIPVFSDDEIKDIAKMRR